MIAPSKGELRTIRHFHSGSIATRLFVMLALVLADEIAQAIGVYIVGL